LKSAEAIRSFMKFFFLFLLSLSVFSATGRIEKASQFQAKKIPAQTYVPFQILDSSSTPELTVTTNASLLLGPTAGSQATTNSSIGIEINSVTKALMLSRMTTAQMNALNATNGMMIYNTSTNSFKCYINAAWANCDTSDITGSGTANSVAYFSASNTLSSIAQTDGQLLIGRTGNSPLAATITSGSGITITNGPGSITIAATGSSSNVIGKVIMGRYNGTGSTNTRVAKFSSTITASGSITVDNSATNGFSATVTDAGVLCASFSAQMSGLVYACASINASQFTTDPQSMTAGQCLFGEYYNDMGTMMQCFNVADNDVFRIHVGGAQSAGASNSNLTTYGLTLYLYP
jgi:hypothetical protein